MLSKIIFLLSFLTQGYLNVVALDCSDYAEEERLFEDVGTNVTIPCSEGNFSSEKTSVFWVRDGEYHDGEKVLEDGSLQINNLTLNKTGCYICKGSDDEQVFAMKFLIVKAPPDAPTNVVIHASTVIATINWHLDTHEEWESFDEGLRTSMHIQYKTKDSKVWQSMPHHVAPNQGQLDVYQLHPNTTYEFHLWARNSYGISEVVEKLVTTRHASKDDELAKKFLTSSEDFTPHAWLVAVVCILFVMNIFGGALLIMYCREHAALLPLPTNLDAFLKGNQSDPERIELVPHIIENPAYHMDGNQCVDTDLQSLIGSSSRTPAAVV